MTIRAFRAKAVLPLIVLVVLLAGACGEEGGGSGGEESDAAAQPSSAAPAELEPFEGCGADETEIVEGLCYAEHEAGSGPEAKKGDIVEVHYTGKLTDGTVFDSSEGGDPIEFPLGTGYVIEGWDKGIAGMKVGASSTLTIAPELGYGEAGYPPDIPPNAALVFDVELVSIKSSNG
jgi:FKBP-type peptidyl-prolyl cis-trans isomerase